MARRFLRYTARVLADLRRLPRGEFARKYGVHVSSASQAARRHGLPRAPCRQGLVYEGQVLEDLRRLSRTAFARKYGLSVSAATRAAQRNGLPRSHHRRGIVYAGRVLEDLRRLSRTAFACKYGVPVSYASRAARYHGLPVRRTRPRGFWRSRAVRRNFRRLSRVEFSRRYRISRVYASFLGVRLGIVPHRPPRPQWKPSPRFRRLIGRAADRVVAHAAHVCLATVAKYRRRHGIPHARSVEISQWCMAEVWKRRKKGWSVDRIVEDLWVPRDMVRRMLTVRRMYLRARVVPPA